MATTQHETIALVLFENRHQSRTTSSNTPLGIECCRLVNTQSGHAANAANTCRWWPTRSRSRSRSQSHRLFRLFPACPSDQKSHPIKRTTPMAHRKAQVDQTVPRSHADFADAWPLLDHLRAINCVPRQTLLRIVGAINCGRAANVVLPRVVRRQRRLQETTIRLWRDCRNLFSTDVAWTRCALWCAVW